MAKLGDVVILKTTGEQVVLLRNSEADGDFYGKRPCMTENGIVHHVELFSTFEFWSEEDHLKHQLEQMKLKKKLQAELKEENESDGPDFAALRVN